MGQPLRLNKLRFPYSSSIICNVILVLLLLSMFELRDKRSLETYCFWHCIRRDWRLAFEDSFGLILLLKAGFIHLIWGRAYFRCWSVRVVMYRRLDFGRWLFLGGEDLGQSRWEIHVWILLLSARIARCLFLFLSPICVLRTSWLSKWIILPLFSDVG